jgi:hypothetical protein
VEAILTNFLFDLDGSANMPIEPSVAPQTGDVYVTSIYCDNLLAF